MKRLAPGAVLLLAATLSACGYFNSYYNASRSFAEAERAARRGESSTAARAYAEAIEKAAVSYRNHPDSRWADDALLLVGRARFARGEYAAARAALGRLLEQARDADQRALANLYLGASLAALGQADSALPPLADGLAADLDERHLAFGRLWQGRARLEIGQAEGWADLEATAARSDVIGLEAALELAARALGQNDAARTRIALGRLLAMGTAHLRVDSVLATLDAAEQRLGAAVVLQAFAGAAPAGSWPLEPRSKIGIRHARLTAAAGDTALALRQLGRVLQNAPGQVGGAGRQLSARWQLARLHRAEELAQVRATLLPGIAHQGVLAEVRRLRTVEALLARARSGQRAALFAAAEFARDSLGAPQLARELFLAYADVAAGTVWAPKALIAAHALTAEALRAPMRERIERAAGNPYVAALSGRTDDAAFTAAEERLGRAVAAVRADASAEAQSGDLRVTRALTTLDSLRVSALTDSLRVRCGGLLDSLALAGVRSDSVRAACMRSDSVAMTQYLAIDTLLLRPGAAADSARRAAGVARDTLVP